MCCVISNFAKIENIVSSATTSEILIEANMKRVLFESNANEKRAMASTTKIVTAITVIENNENLETEVLITKEMVGIEGSSIYLREGEKLSLRELLYGLMLRSGNDCAVALALATSNSIEKFATLMNETARKCGAVNSNFTNPHGLDDANHYTTAYDLALISAYALENEEFLKIVSTKTTKISNDGYEYDRVLKNKNKLLTQVEGCIGVKTGYTSNAGRCLVSAVERDGMRLVCVVLNCGPMFERSTELFETNFSIFKNEVIFKKGESIKEVMLDNAYNINSVGVGVKENVVYPLKEVEKKDITFSVDILDNLSFPIEKDKEVGNLSVFMGKDLIFSQKLVTITSVNDCTLLDALKGVTFRWSNYENQQIFSR